MFLVCSFIFVVFSAFFFCFFNLLYLRSPFPGLQVWIFFLPFGFCPPKVGPVVCVSFIQGEICADFLFGCLFFLWWARLSEVVILSADYLVCIFILFVVQMRCPTQGATDDWVMAGLVFKWFPLWVLTIWYSLRLVLWWSGCLESVLPLQRLRAWSLVRNKVSTSGLLWH